MFLLRRSKEQICLLCTKVITKKDLKRKLTKACLNLIAGKETSSGEGSLLTSILCRNCADTKETVVRKILASSKVELFPAPVGAETNTFLPDRYASTVLIFRARAGFRNQPHIEFNRKSRFVEHSLSIWSPRDIQGTSDWLKRSDPFLGC